MAVSQQAQGSSSELRVQLLGKTGVGKSASGNTILGTREFLSDSSSSSITNKSMKRKAVVAGRRVAVIDTPGFFDTELSEDDCNLEILRCISLCSPGPHAFLLVMPVGRYTKHERETVQEILEKFNDDVLRYTIVLFTRADDLKGKTIEEFVQSGSQELRELVEKCGGRYHAFNNENLSDHTQVTELLEKIKSMVTENGGSHYTNEIYQLAEEEIRLEQERKQRESEEGSGNSYHTLNTENTSDLSQVTEAKIRQKQERKLREREEGSGNSYHTLNTENTSDLSQVTELLQTTERMVAENGVSHYTNEMYQLAEEEIRLEQERILREREEGSGNSNHTLNTENTSDLSQVTEAKIRQKQERKLREREEGSGNSYHTLNTEDMSDCTQVTEAKIRREQESKLREREEGSDNSNHTLNTENTSDLSQVTESKITPEHDGNNDSREEAENSNGFINKWLSVLAGAAVGVGLGLLLGYGIGIYLAATTGGAAAAGKAVVVGGVLGGVAGWAIGYEASGPSDAVNKLNNTVSGIAETAYNIIKTFAVPVHSKQQ